MKSSMPAVTRLLLLILFASLKVSPFYVHVIALRSSTSPTIPFTSGPTKVDKEDIFPDNYQKNDNTKKIKYDLGLGKNHAINSGNDNNNFSSLSHLSSEERLKDPTQFLVEHEAVRSYPSPLINSKSSQINDYRNNEERNKSSNNNSKRKRKNLPIVRHVRKSQDFLHIQDAAEVDNNEGFGHHPIIIPINHSSSVGDNTPVVKFDLNTVWVEMMLHNEHKKMILN